MKLAAGTLDRRIRFERKTTTRDDDFNSEVVTWVPFATVWAEIRDV
ncbi:MAG: head-tail adaptor protein, partial [Comamonadaceae bacterium]